MKTFKAKARARIATCRLRHVVFIQVPDQRPGTSTDQLNRVITRLSVLEETVSDTQSRQNLASRVVNAGVAVIAPDLTADDLDAVGHLAQLDAVGASRCWRVDHAIDDLGAIAGVCGATIDVNRGHELPGRRCRA